MSLKREPEGGGKAQKEEGNSNHLVKYEGKGGRHRERETGAFGNFCSKSGWRHTARAASKECLEPKAHAKLGLGFASSAHFCKTGEAAGPGCCLPASPTRRRLSLKSSPIPLRRAPQPSVAAWRMKARGTFLKDLRSLFLSSLHLTPFPEPCTDAYLAIHSLCKIKITLSAH